MQSAFHQVKPIIPNLPTAVIRIDVEYKPDSCLTWFTGTIMPANKQVLIALTNNQYHSIIETVRSGNSATQGILLETVIEFSNHPEINAESCQVLENLLEVNYHSAIAEYLHDENVVKGINSNFNFKHSMNVCWTNSITGQERWTPIWATNTFLIQLMFHKDFESCETKFKFLEQQLFIASNHNCFAPSTLSLYDALKDELDGWSITDITFAHADAHENSLRRIFKNHNIPSPF